MHYFLSLLLIINPLLTPVWANPDLQKIFPKPKPIIAAIMVESLAKISLEEAEKWLILQAEIASRHKMDGLLIEFRGGGILSRDIPQKELKQMAALTQKVISQYPQLVVGVEILWHFPGSTLKLAKMAQASFVRVDFFSDSVIADNIEVPIDPAALIKYRKNLDAQDILLLTDIQVKYSRMLHPHISLEESAQKAKALESDGVIVSGSQSGTSPAVKNLISAKKGAGDLPVVIGSGFSIKNAPEILPHVDAVIVGTSISEKTGGPLLPDKVAELMSFVEKFRESHKMTTAETHRKSTQRFARRNPTETPHTPIDSATKDAVIL